MSAQLEAERKDFESQLELVVASLRDDPDNAELVGLKHELDQMIQLIDDSLADLKPSRNEASAAAPAAAAPTKKNASPPSPSSAADQKWSRENHPAFKKAASPAAPATAVEDKEPEVIISYQVNDTVLAKWLSGDKGFYPARITSVTGSSTAPIYTVRFKSYDTVETLRAKDIRPVKRKADGTPAGASPAYGSSGSSAAAAGPSSLNSGIVLSAAADLYPQPAKAEGEGAEEKVKPKFKKIKANKELEAGKSKWQEFNQKGKFGKGAKKDSMFRTPEGVRGRVGFTGSGQAMRKDPTRSRHVYQPNEDVD
ncbi:hypothetical protein B0T17DRAFT_487710 [Bombardia bombarda]|uniref:Tudor domain-containing protein n=1 Tax=Bombardia bombarda TaxID=252184 RepID=A0AA40C962_9PEZI|nr:hypothetical protein B0T17DRAFT_487710 [Bombardia bombarda]